MNFMFEPYSAESHPKTRSTNLGYVYMAIKGSLTKIGASQNIESRMRTLSSRRKKSICVYATSAHKNYFDTEKSLLRLMGDFKVNGEWFSCHPDFIVSESLRFADLDYFQIDEYVTQKSRDKNYPGRYFMFNGELICKQQKFVHPNLVREGIENQKFVRQRFCSVV